MFQVPEGLSLRSRTRVRDKVATRVTMSGSSRVSSNCSGAQGGGVG